MIDALLTKFASGKRPPATADQIADVQRDLKITLPPAWIKFYSRSDGLELQYYSLEFTDLATSSEFAAALFNSELPRVLGWFPFSESNESNPFCVCCQPPLFGRIIHLRHDSGPELAFRDLDEMAVAIVSVATSDDWNTNDIEYGYAEDHLDRVADDDTAADNLLAECPDDDIAISMAIALYSHSRVDSIVRFLEHDSMWVREESARQLGLMRNDAAIDGLERLARKGTAQDSSAAQHALNRFRG